MPETVVECVRRLAARSGLAEVSRPVVIAGCVIVGAIAALGIARVAGGHAADGGSGSRFEYRSSADSSAAPTSRETSEPAIVVVHVAGAVVSPGVVRLPEGARVIDAVEQAGGVLGSAAPDAVNLAETVRDGQRICIPTSDEVVSAGGGADAGAGVTPSSPVAGGLVDLNSASAAQLEELPGIGPATAAKICADREANGPFASVDDLMRVSGIGEKKLEGIRDLITAR